MEENTINRQDLERYGVLKKQIKELEAQAKELAPKITEQIIEGGYKEEGVEVEGVGTFSIVTRRTWSYPTDVEQIGKDFKQAKKEAEANGSATYTESSSVMFKG